MRAPSMLLLFAMVAGCDVLDEVNGVGPPRNCVARNAYYPDSDGDGFGEPTAVYIGCEPPAGYVIDLEPVDSDEPIDTDTPIDTDEPIE